MLSFYCGEFCIVLILYNINCFVTKLYSVKFLLWGILYSVKFLLWGMLFSVKFYCGQSSRKCCSAAAPLQAEQGPCEPSEDVVRKFGEQ